MKTNLFKKIYLLTLVSALSLSFLVACSQPKSSTKIANSDAGILLLKVNPEIAIFYDEEGKVTNIESRNDDAKKIIESYTDFKGKDAKK